MADIYAIEQTRKVYFIIHPTRYEVNADDTVTLWVHCFDSQEDALEFYNTHDLSKEDTKGRKKITIPKLHNDDFEPEAYADSICSCIAGGIKVEL